MLKEIAGQKGISWTHNTIKLNLNKHNGAMKLSQDNKSSHSRCAVALDIWDRRDHVVRS